MSANQLLQEWQRAESRCIAAYRAIYAKVKADYPVSTEELSELSSLSLEASSAYQRYLVSVTMADEVAPSWRKASEEIRSRAAKPLPDRRDGSH